MNLIEKIKRAGWYFTDKDRYNHGDLVNREETKTVDPKATIHLVRPEDAKYFTKRRNLAYTASQELSEGEQKRISEYLDITGSIEGFSRLRILPIDETLFARYMSAIEGLEKPTIRQAHLPFMEGFLTFRGYIGTDVNSMVSELKERVENPIERVRLAIATLPITELTYDVHPGGKFVFDTRERLDQESGRNLVTYVIDGFIYGSKMTDNGPMTDNYQRRVVVSGFQPA